MKIKKTAAAILLLSVILTSNCKKNEPPKADPPAIKIQADGKDIKSAQYSFGDLTVGEEIKKDFSIVNIGTTDIVLDENPGISDSSHFRITAPVTDKINSGDKITFTAFFSPSSAGNLSSKVEIKYNGHKYDLTLSGRGMARKDPYIVIKQGTKVIASGSDPGHDFGPLLEGYSTEVIEFTIQNQGLSNLILTEDPPIFISDTENYILTQPAESTILPGKSTTFTLQFVPQVYGNKPATIIIKTNDPTVANQLYTFSITGKALKTDPAINLKQGTTDIPNNTGNHYFGMIDYGSTGTPVTFTIENLGTKNLTLTGDPMVTITLDDQNNFAIIEQPASNTVAKDGGKVTFKIRFQPQTPGSKSAKVNIVSDDPEIPLYTFNITGDTPIPKIKVSLNSDEVYNLPDNIAHEFDKIVINNNQTVDFTIHNIGEGYLRLVGDKVKLEGDDPSHFIVDSLPADPIPAGGSGIIRIKFKPTTSGDKLTKMTIISNDLNNAIYSFSLKGIGVQQISNLYTYFDHTIEEGKERWYFFNAEKDKTYRIYWKDFEEYTCDVTVSAYKEDGTPYFEDKSDISETFVTSNFINSNEKVYIKVKGASGSASGTFKMRVSDILLEWDSITWETDGTQWTVNVDNELVNSTAYFGEGKDISVYQNTYSDFSIELEAKKVSGNTINPYRLMFRFNKDDLTGYVFALAVDGRYRLYKFVSGGSIPIFLTNTGRPAAEGWVDSQPPSVSVATPTNGAAVSGTIAISANATDNVGIEKVEFYTGTTKIGEDSTAPYGINWDTTSVTNGNHSIMVKAFDLDGNVWHHHIIVNVNNSGQSSGDGPPVSYTNVPNFINTGLNQWNQVKIVANGSTIEIYINDMVTPVNAITDSSISSGKIYLNIDDKNNDLIHFRNLVLQ